MQHGTIVTESGRCWACAAGADPGGRRARLLRGRARRVHARGSAARSLRLRAGAQQGACSLLTRAPATALSSSSHPLRLSGRFPLPLKGQLGPITSVF